MTQFKIETLCDYDQTFIKRGLCPWCMERLFDNGTADECTECADTFTGKLTIED